MKKSIPPKSVYLVSQDLEFLLRQWAMNAFARELTIDFKPYIERLLQILNFRDHEVRGIEYETLCNGLNFLLEGDLRPQVSIDQVYAPRDLTIHVTRACDENRKSVSGLQPRFGSPPFEAQLEQIAIQLGATLEQPVEIVLIDDVVFTGGTTDDLCLAALKVGLHVSRIVCGIYIEMPSEGESFAERLAARGIEFDAVLTFPNGEFSEVVDEICSRDFFVFAPFMGRTLAIDEYNAGFPYLDPFGDAHKWASFGEYSADVSRQLRLLNIDLLYALEADLGQQIDFSHLTRYPMGVRHAAELSERVVLHLQRHHLAQAV